MKLLESENETLIIAHLESKGNKKFLIEEVFVSLNKLVVSTVV